MTSMTDMRLKLVGETLPYVFIESVSINKSTYAFAEDRPVRSSKEGKYVKNEFGNNKLTTSNNILEDNKPGSCLVTVTLSMNDFLRKSIWYNSSNAKHIKIKILQATSKRAFETIKQSNYYNAADAPDSLKNHIFERVVRVPIDKALKDHAVREIEQFDDILCTIKIKESFVVSSDYLGFAVFPYIEVPEVLGAKNSRRVLFEGKVDTKSVSYYSPDGTQWKGLVHQHPEKGLMEGRVHTRRPHNILTAVEHSNRVKDYRIFDKFSKLQNELEFKAEKQDPTRFYSDLLISSDPDGAVRGFFAFDIVGFLKSNSEFNALVNKRNLKKLMSLTRIQDLTVFRDLKNDFEADQGGLIRNPIKPRAMIASFSPVDKSNRRISPTANIVDADRDGVPEKTIGTISELPAAGLGNKRGFSFVDLEMRDLQNGSYIYGANLTVQDPTVNFLKTQLFAIREARKTIITYIEEARHKNNFDKKKGEFTYGYLNGLKIKNNLSISIKGKNANKSSTPWRIAPKIYFKTLENLLGRNIPKSDKKSLQKLLYPTTGDLSGAEQFVTLLDSLLKKLESLNKTPTEASLGNNINKGFFAAAGPKTPSRVETSLKTERLFSETPWKATKYHNSSYQLNYLHGALERSQYGLARINRKTLVNRFNVEVGKYFPDIVGKTENQVADELLSGFRSVYYSNLTPTSIISQDQQIILSRKVGGSYQKANRIISDKVGGPETPARLEALNNMGVTIKRQFKNKKGPTLVNGVEILGDNLKNPLSQNGKDSFVDRTASPEEAGALIDKLAGIIVGSRKDTLAKNITLGPKSSIQERYVKTLLEGATATEEQAEANVITLTTATVKYIIGFDKNMAPIYSSNLPHSARPSIYVLEPARQLISNDTVGIIESSGQALTEQDLREESPRPNSATSLEAPEGVSTQIQTENPCPDGFVYNLELGACISVPGAKKMAFSIDATDPVTEDAEYNSGQVFEFSGGSMTTTTPVRRASAPTTVSAPSSAPASSPTTSTTAPSTTVSTGTGGGGSYGY